MPRTAPRVTPRISAAAIARFDVVGDFHSDELRVTERFIYVDEDTLDYRATIDDPRVYTRPWTIAVRNVRTPPGTEIFEYAGVEGDKDSAKATDEAGRRELGGTK